MTITLDEEELGRKPVVALKQRDHYLNCKNQYLVL